MNHAIRRIALIRRSRAACSRLVGARSDGARLVGAWPACALDRRARSACAALAVAIVWAVLLVIARPAAGQSYWELTPYQIDVQVAFELSPQLNQRRAEQLKQGLEQRVLATIGPMWRASIQTATTEIQWNIFHRLDALSPDLITKEQLAGDKVILLGVRFADDRYLVVGREFDCQTRRWGTPIRLEVRQTALFEDGLFRGLLRAFSPIARIAYDADRNLTLIPRASAIQPFAEDVQFFTPGAICQPIVRRNDRDGNPRENGIQEVPWTFLIVDSVDENGVVHCQAHASSRNNLRPRRRGRLEEYALLIRPPTTPTRLLLRSRTDESVPLAGYEIHASKPGEKDTTLVGVTDVDGALAILPQPNPVQILYVKHGGKVLGRFPFVAGLQAEKIVPIPPDDKRLLVEGELRGLQNEFLDLVIRRQILITRINSHLDSGQVDEAAKLLAKLDKLPSRKPFIDDIASIQSHNASSDPREDALIKGMLKDARIMVASFLDEREIDSLRSKMIQAKRGGQ